MKRLVLLAAAAALVAAACAEPSDVVVQAGQGAATTGISVTGEGRVSGVPDTLTVNVGVAVLRDSVDAAVGDAAALADAMINALREQGVAEEDIRTVDYSIFPEYDFSGNRQVLRGYRVSNQVEVKIRDLERAGAVLDAVTAQTGDETQISGVSFSLEDNEGLVAAARANAWADAEAKASQLAGLAGVELGAPVEIVETLSPDPPVIFQDRAAFEIAADAVTPIEAGQLSVTVTVNVRYGLTG